MTLTQATVPFCPPTALLYRTVDGSCNNVLFKDWGKSQTFFKVGSEGLEPYPWANVPKIEPIPTIADLESLPSDGPRGNARNISNTLCTRQGDELTTIDPINHSMFSVMFGQFVNHDFENNQLVGADENDSPSPLVSYVKDLNDPTCLNEARGLCTNPDRNVISSFSKFSGGKHNRDGTFRTINNASSYLDLDTIYGRTQEDQDKIRTHTEGKLLLVTANVDLFGNTLTLENALPNYPTTGLPVSPNLKSPLAAPNTFTSGDHRVNENVALGFQHTIWAREHNKVCDELLESNLLWRLFPDLFDEVIFQKARAIVIAKYQHVIYEQYFPTAFGSHFNNLLGSYHGYNPLVDPTTSLPFASAAFRYGHFSIINYHVIDECGVAYSNGFPAADQNAKIGNLGMTAPGPAFLSSVGIVAGAGGFGNIARGLINERAAPNRLPSDPNIQQLQTSNDFILDLVSLDIMRARYNQLPNYQKLRSQYHGLDSKTNKIYGLPGCPNNLENSQNSDPIECFVHITGNLETATELSNVYRKVNLIDPIIGMTAEAHVPGSSFSRTSGNIIVDQFKRARDGDRFFYKQLINTGFFSLSERQAILDTTMGEILRRNFDVGDEIPDNPFEAPDNFRQSLINSCSS